MKNSTPIAALLISAIAFTSGCAVINSHTYTDVSGQLVSEDTMAKVETGVTTEKWLIATLGEPSRVTEGAAGSRILEYKSKQVTRKESELLFVIDTSSRSEKKRTISFTVRDGIVVNVKQVTDGYNKDIEF